MSGASIRVGFQPFTQEGLYRGSFINRPVLYNPYQHISQQFVTLAEAIYSSGVPTVKRTVPQKPIRLSPIELDTDEVERFKKRFEKDFPQVKGKKLILLYPSGGLLPIRAWPLKYFHYTCKMLLKRGCAIGIIGMESDKHIANELWSFSASPFCIDLTGYTETVKELILLFHFATLLITNDGGPGHFASLTPIPLIIFFGPETPRLYGPLDDKSFVFYSHLSCSPCLTAYNHRNSPCDGDNKCLKGIKPQYVLQKAYEILENQNC
jgi:ADP-heptose:LPS heptosyltransferase